MSTYINNIFTGDWYDGSGSMHNIPNSLTGSFGAGDPVVESASGKAFAPCATSAEIQVAEDAARAQIGTMCQL